ncbi:MAG: asparagine synthase C-terminal domain-containing protein [Candidatus Nanoarchaeia archaeon]|nr:asparagine synthase C-terminal domain-containing protein [Candidatus Nanoarchaeia archaeon]MDD5239501.1 asparagine synthase C-terminal domain-containing protein [Candidatus Nanoarchaeia archaeon]
MGKKEKLKQALVAAVKKLAKGKIALLLSGGLDSSVIAKILKDLRITFTAYTSDFGGPDTAIAKKLSKQLRLKHKTLHFTGNPEKLVEQAVKITKTTDPVQISVAIPMILAAEAAAKDGNRMLFSGLGSDEFLCGYGSHAKAMEKGYKAVHSECLHRLVQVRKDIKRDSAVCRHFGLKPALPFMDKKVVNTALSIHPQEKISPTQKKIVLRKIAKEIGLPEYVYNRPKKAAQYGSGSFTILKCISKEKGFKFVKDYLGYVNSASIS